MEDQGFTLVDVTHQFSQFDYVKKVYVALSEDGDYQIEFFETEDDSKAIEMFNLNNNKFENNKGYTSAQNEIKGKNYSKFELSSNGKYMVISVINNTGVYLDVDSKYKSEVKDILKDLGY